MKNPNISTTVRKECLFSDSQASYFSISCTRVAGVGSTSLPSFPNNIEEESPFPAKSWQKTVQLIRFSRDKVSRLPGRGGEGGGGGGAFAPRNSANSVSPFSLKGLWKSFFFAGEGKPDFRGLRCHGSNVGSWWNEGMKEEIGKGGERMGWATGSPSGGRGGGGACFVSLWIIVFLDRLSICTCRRSRLPRGAGKTENFLQARGNARRRDYANGRCPTTRAPLLDN